MTPKEKAQELINKYRTYVVMWAGGVQVANENVKQCAIIAVDEILKGDHLIRTPLSFWEEVKNCINKTEGDAKE